MDGVTNGAYAQVSEDSCDWKSERLLNLIFW